MQLEARKPRRRRKLNGKKGEKKEIDKEKRAYI